MTSPDHGHACQRAPSCMGREGYAAGGLWILDRYGIGEGTTVEGGFRMRITRLLRLSLGVLLTTLLWYGISHRPPYAPASAIQPGPVTAEAASAKPPGQSPGAQPTATPQQPSPGVLADLDLKDGFRGLKFGDPPTSGMVLKDDAGEKKYYTRPQDDLSIGEARIDQLIYGFSKNRLSTILIRTKGLSNGRALLEALRQIYGPGTQPDPSLPRYSWLGRQVSVSYNENTVTHDADTWFHHVPVQEAESAGAEKAQQKGKPRSPSSSWRWGPLDMPEGRR